MRCSCSLRLVSCSSCVTSFNFPNQHHSPKHNFNSSYSSQKRRRRRRRRRRSLLVCLSCREEKYWFWKRGEKEKKKKKKKKRMSFRFSSSDSHRVSCPILWSKIACFFYHSSPITEENPESRPRRWFMPCCSWKRAGTCQRCACFTSGVPCTDCYPSWDNCCKNGGNLGSTSSSSNNSSTRNSHRFIDNDEKRDGAQDGSRSLLLSHSQPAVSDRRRSHCVSHDQHEVVSLSQPVRRAILVLKVGPLKKCVRGRTRLEPQSQIVELKCSTRKSWCRSTATYFWGTWSPRLAFVFNF